MEDIFKRIHDYSLEEIMGERFGRYAKTIIQDRAIPDVRDGLKPVQRRILFAMYKGKVTYDKAYHKSAKTVGLVIGNYHPHGDSSVYNAMVRMSQWWKLNTPYIDMQGNNGSMDGDSAAAMRYTESRLSKISGEMLKDLEKDTVMFSPTFDDTELEPTVLPARFPNLLVNGASGISAGYATNIPPHNLGEVIDATIKRIDSPNSRLETIMEYIKGPDFPTGGIIEGKDGIINAFTEGKGRVIVRAKIELKEEKGKKQLIVTELPYDVNKALLVKKIDEIRIDKKIDGLIDVRDETDRDGLCIAIDLKKDANDKLILNYLLKNTDLQIAFNYNMVAIVNRCPKTLGVLEILDAYIAHQKEIIIKRSEFDLATALKQMHIVEGLVKAMSILDEVIKTIRASKNKGDAEDNLVKQFNFTKEQAVAIVTLQLYRLTNFDIVALQEKLEAFKLIIKELQLILNDVEELKKVMKQELREIKKEYATPRKSIISDEVLDIKIDIQDMITKEDCVVIVTNDGYIKRVSTRSYNTTKNDDPTIKEGDYVTKLFMTNTTSTLLMFTNLGNYLFIPVHTIPELKYKEMGKHVSNLVIISSDEYIVDSYIINDFNQNLNVTTFSALGFVKRTELKEFMCLRYSKPVMCMKLKPKDYIVSVDISVKENTFITTKHGYGLWYDITEIPLAGLRASGVKSINLKNDLVVSAHVFDGKIEYLTVFTSNMTAKRIKLTEFEKTTRTRKGLLIVREVKTNPYYIYKTFMLPTKNILGIKIDEEIKTINLTDIKIMDRFSTGSLIDNNIKDVFFFNQIICDNDIEEVVEIKNTEKEIDILTIDDFIN